MEASRVVLLLLCVSCAVSPCCVLLWSMECSGMAGVGKHRHCSRWPDLTDGLRPC